jgi:hypothetical protein
MPAGLSLATVATCAALAAAVFGGAYALAHDEPPGPAPTPASPTPIRLEREPIGELHRASPLPALIVPPPRTQPAEVAPVAEAPSPAPAGEVPAPVVAPTPQPAPTPEPTPAPAPKPPPPAKKPLTFDDSG